MTAPRNSSAATITPAPFTVWPADGGIKPGVTIGHTDDVGYIGEHPVSVHNLSHCTVAVFGR